MAQAHHHAYNIKQHILYNYDVLMQYCKIALLITLYIVLVHIQYNKLLLKGWIIGWSIIIAITNYDDKKNKHVKTIAIMFSSNNKPCQQELGSIIDMKYAPRLPCFNLFTQLF